MEKYGMTASKIVELIHMMIDESSEQIGVGETKHKHLFNVTRTLLFKSGLPFSYLVKALLSANHLIKRMSTRSINFMASFEKLFHKKPNYDFLKVFGCSCFPWLKPYTSTKLEPKSRHCVFLRYSLTQKGYRCLDPSTGHVYISRHVTFNETSFPFKDSVTSTPQMPLSPSTLTSNSTVPADFSTSAIPSPFSSTPIIQVTPYTSVTKNDHNMVTRGKNGIKTLKSYYASKHKIPLALLATNLSVPTCIIAANKLKV